jgi:hypothetical protein
MQSMRARYLLALGILVAAVAADHLFSPRPLLSGPAALQAILDARADAPKPNTAVSLPPGSDVAGASIPAPIPVGPAIPSLVLGARGPRPVLFDEVPVFTEEAPIVVDEAVGLASAEFLSVPVTGTIQPSAPPPSAAPEPSPTLTPTPTPDQADATSPLAILEVPLLTTQPDSLLPVPEETAPTEPIASEPVPDPTPTPTETTRPPPRRDGSPSDTDATPLIDLSF